jgi:MFS family permease
MTRPPLQLSALVSLIFNSVVFVVGNSFLPIYIVRDLGQSAVLAGTLLAARNVAMTVASPLFGLAVARFGLIATMLGSNSVAVLGMVGVALVPDPQFLYIPLALAGFGTGFAAATANTLVTDATARHERALGFATNSLVARGGSIVSPLVFGAILEISGSAAVFSAAGLLGIAYIAAMAARVRLGTAPASDRLAEQMSEDAPIARPVGD